MQYKYLFKQLKNKQLKKNVGTTDKIVRIVAAVLVAVLYFTGVISGTLAIVLLVFSAVFIATAFMSYCPLYSIFGIKTCPFNKDETTKVE